MANPFVFRKTRNNKRRHRLTDIQTEEVSLVDKGANKRKFALIKADTETNEMAKLNAEATLEKVTAGLTKLAEFTETVKTFVEKADANTDVPVEDWAKLVQSFSPWMTDVLGTLKVEEAATTTETTTTATETVTTAATTEDTTAATTAVATETTVTATAATTTETAVAATTTATETTTTEAAASTETTTTTEATVSATELVGDIAKSMLDLKPSVEAIKKNRDLLDRLFISGGLSINTWDVEALAMVCNAICASAYDATEEDATDPGAMMKSAEKILAEAGKRTDTVAKRVAKAEKATDTDGKELKVVDMLLETVADALVKKTETTATETTQTMDKAAIEKMVNDAVSAATKDIVTQTTSLKQQITKLETDKTQLEADKTKLQKDLNAALATPAVRASSQETVAKTESTTRVINVNRNGVTDYNEPN